MMQPIASQCVGDSRSPSSSSPASAAERARADPAQRRHLHRVRQGAAQDRDQQRLQQGPKQVLGCHGRRQHRRQAERHHCEAGDGHPEGGGAAGSDPLADESAEHDVAGPAQPGAEGEGGAQRVDTRHRLGGTQQQRQAGQHQRRPQQVERPPRADEGEGQRAGELDRHRGPQRHPRERQVEQQVHQPERQAVRHQGAQPGAIGQPAPWPPQRPQHDRRQRDAQADRAGGAEDREQRFRHRGAELIRDDAAEQHRQGECEAASRRTTLPAWRSARTTAPGSRRSPA